MAIMRTNRLSSKTTPPPRKIITEAEAYAQDAAYKKYKEQDLPLYEKRMQRYNQELKSPPKDYNAVFGGKKNVRYLDKAELAEYNKNNLREDPTNIEYGSVEVGKSYSKKVGDKDWMIGAAHHTHNPIKPTAPTKVDPTDWSNVKLEMAKIKTPTRITSKPGKLRGYKGQEEPPGFTAPGVETTVKSKTYHGSSGTQYKTRRAQDVEKLNMEGKQADDPRANKKPGYKRQEKLFKSYAGTSVLGESHIGKSANEIRDYKKEMKSQRRAYRREDNLEGIAATGMEVRQARQAERFVKGKQTHFNDENYQKTTGKTSRIAPDYRKSTENATNRNTMQAKLDAISAKGKNNTSLY